MMKRSEALQKRINRMTVTTSLTGAQLAGTAPLPPYQSFEQLKKKSTFKDLTDDIRELPLVSYGYPMLVAVIGLAIIGSFMFIL